MDPQKQKQLISQLYESSAKTEEELNKMSPEERREYLQNRLKQKMFFSNASRQSMNSKKQIQEKMQEKLEETSEKKSDVKTEAQKERNRRKRQKKKEKMNSKDNELGDDVVVVNSPDENGSESDYHSD